MKYAFIRDHTQDWSVTAMCQILEVHRSAYYDWRDQPSRVISEHELTLRRRKRELFKASRSSLGSRTLTKNLRQEGFGVGRTRVRKLVK